MPFLRWTSWVSSDENIEYSTDGLIMPAVMLCDTDSMRLAAQIDLEETRPNNQRLFVFCEHNLFTISKKWFTK